MTDVKLIQGMDAKQGVQYKTRKILRVAAYCRVSTDYEDQLASQASQIRYYTDFINANQNWKLVGIYADEGITGTLACKRDQFLQLIADCEAGKIDMIITNIKTPYLIQSQTRVQTSEVLATRASEVFCCPATLSICR